jgi:uncharacterized protein YbcC (UPF0753/DUF2309 family)
MSAALSSELESDHHGVSPGRRERPALAARLRQAIEHSGHFLPAQGPITVFIHHNTLHAFEDLSFDDGVKQGGKLFGCQPYLSEDRYRDKLERGRITVGDLVVQLLEDLGSSADERVAGFCRRLELRLGMLQYPMRLAPAAELRWFVAETDALTRMRDEVSAAERDRFVAETRHWVMRDLLGGAEGSGQSPPFDRRGEQSAPDEGERRVPDALAGLLDHFGRRSIEQWSEQTWEAFTLQTLWRICREGVHGIKLSPPALAAGARHRDLLLEATGTDIDLLVNDLLVPFCASFVDQGFSRWPLPHRDEGFFRAFAGLYRRDLAPPDLWLEDLPSELARLEQARIGPEESILESLDLLGVTEPEWETFITGTLLALRGWAGMIRQVEVRADSVAHPIPAGSLVEFLAVRLILERLALAWVARDTLRYEGPLSELRQAARTASQKPEAAGVDQRAFQVFQLAQVMGWLPAELHRISKTEWASLVAEIEAFPSLERRRILHSAFERRYRVQTLDAIALNARKPSGRVPNPRFQVMCCLDEREESFRRHLEEIAPDVETFGPAGFYGVPIYYRGAADAHYVPLCPIVIKPQHWVEEDVVYTLDEVHSTRAKARKALGLATHRVHVGSRTFWGGALLTAGLGALASIPLVARVLFPRLTAQVRQLFSRIVEPPPQTRLELERSQSQPGPELGHVGFTLEEMTNLSERLLKDIGLTSSFARLVIILGHGSNSLNNPHNSAYNCGACGGSCGGPNARALAHLLSDPRVRERLKARGLQIPDDTIFIGGWHNTCNDDVMYFDLERLPKSHKQDFDRVRREIEETCERNAHERCRRFISAPLNMSFAAARRHVEARSEDLAQTRPELGHATNALCIVARRSRTRGLYMDRRAFLTTYDPTQDDAESSTLVRLLSAAVPVCAGINLEYYFSHVDPTGYGCGTKLPHNVTSLLGIMDGAASDLRPGLPWQMVEIHEAVRLLFVIETTPQAMLSIMERFPGIGKLCRNGWVQVAVLSPDSAQIQVLRGNRFEPYRPESTDLPKVASSVDWYRGWREHLGYALIEK